jgi:Response regulator containing CheY-like receiver domain and AraC-type DNA-binding domain
MLKSALTIKGYNVDTASNGKEAKALYQSNVYDVIITDIIMPNVDGYEVILDLRRMGMGDRIIAVSGGGRTAADDYLITAKHFDVAATFNKPVDLQALRAKVEEIIQKH